MKVAKDLSKDVGKAIIWPCQLIEKSMGADFDKEVKALANLYDNKLVLSYTGPWTPYNFIDANINIK